MRGDNFVSVGKCCQFQDVANVEQGRISINSRTVGSDGSTAKKPLSIQQCHRATGTVIQDPMEIPLHCANSSFNRSKHKSLPLYELYAGGKFLSDFG